MTSEEKAVITLMTRCFLCHPTLRILVFLCVCVCACVGVCYKQTDFFLHLLISFKNIIMILVSPKSSFTAVIVYFHLNTRQKLNVVLTFKPFKF